MITCAYCGNECPDDAQICPKCGKPIIRLAVDDEPDYNKMAMELLQNNEQKEPLSQKNGYYHRLRGSDIGFGSLFYFCQVS